MTITTMRLRRRRCRLLAGWSTPFGTRCPWFVNHDVPNPVDPNAGLLYREEHT